MLKRTWPPSIWLERRLSRVAGHDACFCKVTSRPRSAKKPSSLAMINGAQSVRAMNPRVTLRGFTVVAVVAFLAVVAVAAFLAVTFFLVLLFFFFASAGRAVAPTTPIAAA